MIIQNFKHILMRFKSSSILNIVGLSAAIFIFLVVTIQLHYDLTFNHSIGKANDTYLLAKMVSNPYEDSYGSEFDLESIEYLTDFFPEIKNHCCIVKSSPANDATNFWLGSEGYENGFNQRVAMVTEGYVEIFEPTILEGSVEDVFALPNGAMISRSSAKRIFGNQSPIGEVVRLPLQTVTKVVKKESGTTHINISNKNSLVTIKAIYDDYSQNSSINSDFVVYRPAEEYIDYDEVYLEINSSHIEQLREKLKDPELLENIDMWVMRTQMAQNLEEGEQESLLLLPIKNINLTNPEVVQEGKNINNVYFLLLVGFFTLAIAYINYVNFSTAMAPARVRAVNIKMVMGADKSSLRAAIASEAPLFTLIALLIATFLLWSIAGSNIENMFSASLAVVDNVGLILATGGVLLLLSFLIGLYPAHYITNFDPVMALNSSNTKNVRSSMLRNILMVIQFTVAIIIVAVMLIAKSQHSYLSNRTLGFAKDNVLTLKLYGEQRLLNSPLKTFVNELERNPAIESYTLTNELMGAGGRNTSGMSYGDSSFVMNTLIVTDNFCDFWGVELIEGEPLTELSKRGKSEYVVNKQFLTSNNIKGGLVGLAQTPFGQDMQVGAILEDFNFATLYKNINPLLLMVEPLENDRFVHLYVRPATGKTLEAREHIEQLWREFSDSEIELSFLDDKLERLYQNEKELSDVISIVGLVVVIIAIMGVYGMITFNTKYRTKEIALRKINGAKVGDIIVLLNRGLIIQYLVAVVIAMPVIYLFAERWLQRFPYRIAIGWWIFATSALLVLLITAITVSVQSYRAATVNPANILKSE